MTVFRGARNTVVFAQRLRYGPSERASKVEQARLALLFNLDTSHFCRAEMHGSSPARLSAEGSNLA